MGRRHPRQESHRQLAGEVAQEFFRPVVRQARAAGLTSDEHGTVDGTLVEAWAGHQSLVRQDSPVPSDDDPGNPTVGFRREKRSHATHQSTKDPEARLDKKSRGAEAKLTSLGHVVTENRHGLVVNARLTPATGTAERAAALAMARERPGGTRRLTLGADKGYDAAEFMQGLRELHVTPHVAQNVTEHRGSNVDERTTRHAGYAISQRQRKWVEEVFGWLKTVGTMRKTRHRGQRTVEWVFTLAVAADNLVRLSRLLPQAA